MDVGAVSHGSPTDLGNTREQGGFLSSVFNWKPVRAVFGVQEYLGQQVFRIFGPSIQKLLYDRETLIINPSNYYAVYPKSGVSSLSLVNAHCWDQIAQHLDYEDRKALALVDRGTHMATFSTVFSRVIKELPKKYYGEQHSLPLPSEEQKQEMLGFLREAGVPELLVKSAEINTNTKLLWTLCRTASNTQFSGNKVRSVATDREYPWSIRGVCKLSDGTRAIFGGHSLSLICVDGVGGEPENAIKDVEITCLTELQDGRLLAYENHGQLLLFSRVGRSGLKLETSFPDCEKRSEDPVFQLDNGLLVWLSLDEIEEIQGQQEIAELNILDIESGERKSITLPQIPSNLMPINGSKVMIVSQDSGMPYTLRVIDCSSIERAEEKSFVSVEGRNYGSDILALKDDRVAVAEMHGVSLWNVSREGELLLQRRLESKGLFSSIRALSGDDLIQVFAQSGLITLSEWDLNSGSDHPALEFAKRLASNPDGFGFSADSIEKLEDGRWLVEGRLWGSAIIEPTSEKENQFLVTYLFEPRSRPWFGGKLISRDGESFFNLYSVDAVDKPSLIRRIFRY